MNEEIQKSEKPLAIPLIYQKIISIMRDVPGIGKNQKNTFHNYNFRGIDDVYNTIHPLLAKHGVFTTSEITDKDISIIEVVKNETLKKFVHAIITVSYKFIAEDGSFVQSVTIGESLDNGDKGTPKALSMAFKYAMFQMLCIPTGEKLDTENYENVLSQEQTRVKVKDQVILNSKYKKAIDESQNLQDLEDAWEKIPLANQKGLSAYYLRIKEGLLDMEAASDSLVDSLI